MSTTSSELDATLWSASPSESDANQDLGELSSPVCMGATSSGFEGVEKKLEIDFKGVGLLSAPTLRAIPRDEWDAILWDAKCCIINTRSNDLFDAYLLSESSLFVYDSKIMIKTCGTTTLLLMLPRLLEVVREICGEAVTVEFLQFSRSSFLFPQEQRFPHTSFEQEVKFLQQYFDGDAYTLGRLNGPTWHLYIADYTETKRKAQEFTDQSIEVIMYDLDPTSMAHFFKNESFVSAEEVTRASGIKGLMLEGTLIDDFSFDPCGYSLNALNGNVHYTIHITPEAHCSYVSFETNLPSTDYVALVSNVISVFRPGRFAVALIADQHSIAGDSDLFKMNSDVEGYSLKDNTAHKFAGSYKAIYCYYARNDASSSVSQEASQKVPKGVLGAARADGLESASALKNPVGAVSGGVSSQPSASSEKATKTRYTGWGQCADLFDELNVEKIPDSVEIPSLIRAKINQEEMEEAFFLMDLGIVAEKFSEWTKKLPRVQPFYALKCNTNPGILKMLNRFGCHFQCSTQPEIEAALAEGIPANKILYSNPCKMPNQIKQAKKNLVNFMVFDSESELQKIAANHPSARLLMRIILPDATVAENASHGKYGVSVSDCHGLLRAAIKYGLHVVGVSFDVGFNWDGNSPEKYAAGLECAKSIFNIADSLGIIMNTIDIGGGFPGVDNGKIAFDSLAEIISQKVDALFSKEIKIIAETGRFMTSTCATLAVNVFARRVVAKGSGPILDHDADLQGVTPRYLYYVNDGVYGSFNCLLFDKAKVTAIPLDGYPNEVRYPCTIFGPTCDGLDCIADRTLMPELNVGDWLYFPNMGSYTTTAATNFNGFPATRIFYICAGSN
eukprot:TRINITY_DN1846_c0_g1_i1.p1 TRINITY_DN1846_c0_g1~~TRINITY_DN1846_c0_g1_i1.p1  ORF type:complete len:844 (-),score=175.81 TRINITY_DN1846_c0_g1_i1:474-3005(-)